MPSDLTRREFARSAALAAASALATQQATGSAQPPRTELPVIPDATWNKAPCRFCGTGCHVQVAVKEGKRKKALFANFDKRMQSARLPQWLTLDVQGYGFKVAGKPDVEEAGVPVDIRAIVELFAR